MVLKKIIHKLHIPCKEITFLLEKKSANKISKIENIRLTLHLLYCKWCKSYNKKITFMDNYIKSNHKKNEENIVINIDEINNLKEKIVNKLNL